MLLNHWLFQPWGLSTSPKKLEPIVPIADITVSQFNFNQPMANNIFVTMK